MPAFECDLLTICDFDGMTTIYDTTYLPRSASTTCSLPFYHTTAAPAFWWACRFYRIYRFTGRCMMTFHLPICLHHRYHTCHFTVLVRPARLPHIMTVTYHLTTTAAMNTCTPPPHRFFPAVGFSALRRLLPRHLSVFGAYCRGGNFTTAVIWAYYPPVVYTTVTAYRCSLPISVHTMMPPPATAFTTDGVTYHGDVLSSMPNTTTVTCLHPPATPATTTYLPLPPPPACDFLLATVVRDCSAAVLPAVSPYRTVTLPLLLHYRLPTARTLRHFDATATTAAPATFTPHLLWVNRFHATGVCSMITVLHLFTFLRLLFCVHHTYRHIGLPASPPALNTPRWCWYRLPQRPSANTIGLPPPVAISGCLLT